MEKVAVAVGLAGLALAGAMKLHELSKRPSTSTEWREWLLRRRCVESPEVSVELIETCQDWAMHEKAFSERVDKYGIVGFDAEWVGDRKISLLQICFPDGKCFLVRLIYKIPPMLIRMLRSPKVLKVGVGIEGDVDKFSDDYGLELHGWVDLRHLVLKIKPQQSRLSLGAIASTTLDVMLDKDWRLRASNWEAVVLDSHQIDYAANDAIVAIMSAMMLRLESCSTTPICLIKSTRSMCQDYKEFPFRSEMF